jgi:hypothetical protein
VADPYASHTLSLILSWLLAIPVLWAFGQMLIFGPRKHEKVPWLWSAWITLCLVLLSPVRYVVFVFVAATSFSVQSGWAALTWLRVWPIIVAGLALSLIYVAGLVGPLVLMLLSVGTKTQPSKLPYSLSALAAPIIAVFATLLFPYVLLLASFAVRLTGLPPAWELALRSAR